MFPQSWPKLVVVSLALILLISAFCAWRADRRDRAQLAAELASTKQLLAAADSRQRNRDAQLAQTLATLTAEKRSFVTPGQIVRELSKNVPLPAPITLQNEHASSTGVGARFSLPAQAVASPFASAPTHALVGATPGSPATNASTAAARRADAPRVAARLASPTLASPANITTTSQSNQKTAAEGAFVPVADLKPLYDFTLDCQACQAKLSAAQNDLADERQKTAALTKERDDALRIAKGGSVWRRAARAAKWFVLGAAAGAILSKAR